VTPTVRQNAAINLDVSSAEYDLASSGSVSRRVDQPATWDAAVLARFIQREGQMWATI